MINSSRNTPRYMYLCVYNSSYAYICVCVSYLLLVMIIFKRRFLRPTFSNPKHRFVITLLFDSCYVVEYTFLFHHFNPRWSAFLARGHCNRIFLMKSFWLMRTKMFIIIHNLKKMYHSAPGEEEEKKRRNQARSFFLISVMLVKRVLIIPFRAESKGPIS